jgi:hypothetical protein
MSYCTTEDVRDLLEQVEQFQMATELNLSARIVRAENWLNPHLASMGYEVPFGTAPDYIVDLTATYTCYLVLRQVNLTGQFTDLMREFERRAREMVEDLRSGKVVLTVEPEDEYVPRTQFGVSNPHGKPAWRYDREGNRVKA